MKKLIFFGIGLFALMGFDLVTTNSFAASRDKAKLAASCIAHQRSFKLNTKEKAAYREFCVSNPDLPFETIARNAHCTVEADDAGLHGQARWEARNLCKVKSNLAN